MKRANAGNNSVPRPKPENNVRSETLKAASPTITNAINSIPRGVV
jgi:hypothetical protein